jgi:excisionase family DNA binding protein
MSNPLSAEFGSLLERLVERVAARVYERLVEQQALAASERSPWMGIERAAAYLDWPKQRLYKLSAAGAIPHYKHEGRLLFRADELDGWLSQFAEGERLESPEHRSEDRAIVAFDGNEDGIR